MIGRKAREILGFNDFWFMLWGIPLLGFLIPVIFFDIPTELSGADFYKKWLESSIYAAANWMIARTLIIQLRKRLPGDSRMMVKRLTIQTVVYFLMSNVIAGLCLSTILGQLNIFDNYQPTILEGNVAAMTAYITIASVYEAIYAMRMWKESILENEQLKQERTQAQLNSLRNQVNPHFLFNSLNALASLIPEDPEKAVKFTQKLSQTYRYILEMKDSELIPLEEELEFLDAFRFLNEVRFGENLKFHIDIDSAARRKFITPMALQIAVENAIKHNVVSVASPLYIDIYNENGSLVVRNNYQLKKQEMESTGTGLSNIDARYRFISDRGIDIIQTKDHYMVVLPLLQIHAS